MNEGQWLQLSFTGAGQYLYACRWCQAVYWGHPDKHNCSEGVPSELNHTPGPWEAIRRNIFSSNGYLLGIAYRDPLGGKVNPAEANARLMAAAPEMLEALKALMMRVRTHFHSSPSSASYLDWQEYLTAEAVIRKAEGDE